MCGFYLTKTDDASAASDTLSGVTESIPFHINKLVWHACVGAKSSQTTKIVSVDGLNLCLSRAFLRQYLVSCGKSKHYLKIAYKCRNVETYATGHDGVDRRQIQGAGIVLCSVLRGEPRRILRSVQTERDRQERY